MQTQILKLLTVMLLILATVPVTRAQQGSDQSAPPIPAYHSPLASGAGNGDIEDTSTENLAPDTRSLSGAQNFSLGVPVNGHSYWEPSVNLSTILDSNPSQTSGASGWTTWTSISGGLDVHMISGRSDMSLTYLGGGMLSNTGAASNGVIQSLNFADKILFRRSTLTVFDVASYLPETAFGFGGLGSGIPSLPGSLGAGFAPSQTILTPRGQDLTNVSVVEYNYSLTGRTSLTFVGGYSILHYFDTALLDYGDVTFQGGYNYQMTRKDTIAVSYLFSGFRYSNFNQSINSHTFSVSYGRRVTGRLAFQASIGPQVVIVKIPITGNPETTGAGSTARVYWSAQTALQYQLQHTSLAVSYNHGVSGGSGVLAGSVTDTVSGSASRQLLRATNGMLTFGYSRNDGLNNSTDMPSNQTYSYWFGGVSLGHQLGRTLSINLSYQAQYQDSNSSFCLGPTCGTSVIRNLVSVGVRWQEQPMPF